MKHFPCRPADVGGASGRAAHACRALNTPMTTIRQVVRVPCCLLEHASLPALAFIA